MSPDEFVLHKVGSVSRLVAVLLLLMGVSNVLQAVELRGERQQDEPSRPPTPDDLLKITAPDYRKPAGVSSECLGRMMFDVNETIEWPTFYRHKYPDGIFARSFSDNIEDPYDSMRYGDTFIAVIASTNEIPKEKVFEDVPRARVAALKKYIEEKNAYIARLKKSAKTADANKNEIEDQLEDIQRLETTIAKYGANYEQFETGLPNSEGYWTSEHSSVDKAERDSILRAYLTRGDHIFVFESTTRIKTPSDKETHKKKFSLMLSNFRTRAANEIPSEKGVCIPFGFIQDNGDTAIAFKQTMRFSDAPGVLYTLSTGKVTSRNIKATPLLAMAEAAISPPPQEKPSDPVPKVVQRIGPRIVKMGGLSASQGGVHLKLDQPGGKGYEIYSVFTGYGGWLGTTVLPYILVNMRTMNKNLAPELKEIPPPFAVSKNRMDLIVKSMRWRLTTPPMPELTRR
ncbi:T6SS immunity protein Tli4 family protein [Telluria mixta]|uniref:T6SS immunity protein Tli4 family protein n=1 Tax=Telluria mixta TaxID=34071 RepID=A0ABT2BZ98_9BURK|nr:T6SS immunity protein Tli4 family protein [Telluria mixta]MCS0630455.1 T6SS immunity protein Tli4 family protein [Telluria mixta]WEM94241.1 T6SS immunity protein Tli4 family protein [Telluria mixta]